MKAVLAIAGSGVVLLIITIASALVVAPTAPPPLMSVSEGANAIAQGEPPALEFFKARDGTSIAFAAYGAPVDAAQVVVMIHGSAGSSRNMRAIASSLAADSRAVVAIDVRGHGASGERGDIRYVGQLEDDIEDLLGVLRNRHARARYGLVGFSSGAGFALRVASSPLGKEFSCLILLAPYLRHDSPYNRNTGRAWASASVPRIVALLLLERLGISVGQGLEVVAFAVTDTARAKGLVTPAYSWRLWSNFRATEDAMRYLIRPAMPVDILVGDKDELVDGAAVTHALSGSSGVTVTSLRGIDHMGVLYKDEARSALRAFLSKIT